MKYLTSYDLSVALRSAMKRAHPHLTKEELSLISCHSLRVWACVLLSEAGKGGDYIRVRLRWLSEAYRVYLRDTLKTAQQHKSSLAGNSDEIAFHLLAASMPPLHEQVAEDTEMGEYKDHP